MPDTSHPRTDDGNRFIGLLALSAALVARGLSAALPGAAAGIERWIETTRIAGAVLSQATVVVGVAVAVALLMSTLWQRGFAWGYRSFALPATAIVVTLVVLSARVPLQPAEARILGVSAVLLAGFAGLSGVRSAGTRAAALVLIATSCAGALHLAAHWVVVEVRAFGLTGFSGALASLGFVADVMSVVFAAAWLIGQRRRTLSAAALAAAVLATVVAWGAAVGSTDGAHLWQVLASKALGEVTVTPGPDLNVMIVYWVDGFAFALSALLLVSPRGGGISATAMALSLLVRASPDIPLCALMLVIAALFTALEGARRDAQQDETPADNEPTELSTV